MIFEKNVEQGICIVVCTYVHMCLRMFVGLGLGPGLELELMIRLELEWYSGLGCGSLYH